MTGTRPVKRALIGVSDKTGLARLATGLHEAGVEIVSTGGTAKAIAEAGVPVVPVEQLTGFPESLDGRVKTLHPHVHAGLLADMRKPAHVRQLDELGIAPFDLLVVNLYPFEQTVASGAAPDECVEQIDIGGPAMVRAAAKNHPSVAVVVDPARYEWVLDRVAAGGFTLAERQQLAAQAFAHTASYDVAVASYLNSVVAPEPDTAFPTWVGATWRRANVLRYGENPHQQAALYVSGRSGLAAAQQLHGKEMSYNNYVDADAALRAAYDHERPAVAIIKHANPCGIAVGADVAEAHRKAHACDPLSAFGGVIAANTEVSVAMAERRRDLHRGHRGPVVRRRRGRGAAAQEERAHPGLSAAGAHRSRDARGVRRPVAAVARRGGRRGRRPGELAAGVRAGRGRHHAGRPGVRLAGGAVGEVQRHPAGARRGERRCRHGSGQPGRLLSARGAACR